MKGVFLLIILILPATLVAQISGIGGTKLNAISWNPLPVHTAEFEPTFGIAHTKTFWNDDGEPTENNQTTVSSSISWRVTYTPAPKLEFGLSAPSDLSTGSISSKYVILDKSVLKLGVMTGLNLALGNRTFPTNSPGPDDVSTYGVGLITSLDFDEKNSIDFNVQYQDFFDDLNGTLYGTSFINMEYGYRTFNDKVLLVLGWGYQHSSIGDTSENVMSLYPGISIEAAKRFAVVLNTSHDLFGRNMSKSFGFNLAFTTIWD